MEITLKHQNHVQIFTDGSKVDEKVAAAAVSSVAPNSPFSCRLRDHCSINTAELQAILFALKQAYQSLANTRKDNNNKKVLKFKQSSGSKILFPTKMSDMRFSMNSTDTWFATLLMK